MVIMSRKSSCFFEVESTKFLNSNSKHTVRDIYITELGNIMISVYTEEELKTVNYFCGKIQDILPEGIQIKEVANPQFFLP